MPKLSIDDIPEFKGKKVLVRVDFNVPQNKDGSVANDLRIRSAIPTIKKIIDNGGKAVLMSHLGRPSEKGYEEKYSLLPVAKALENLLGKPVAFAKDCLDAQADVDALSEGGVLLLENLRFYPNEGAKKEADRLDMAKKLAAYADYYVSDAFGTAHRDAASMTGVPKVLGVGYAGYLMKKEIDYFEKALVAPARPYAAIMGGAKVSDKILIIRNLLKKVNKLFIGGAMAYTFLKFQGTPIGSSKCETEADGKDGKIDIVALAGELLEEAKRNNVQVFLPVDHKTNAKFEANENPHVTSDAAIPDGQMALDVGPKTVELYTKELLECKTVLWNGPLGAFELKGFETGTFALGKAFAEHKDDIVTIVGGGDTAAAVEKAGYGSSLAHISTGGGASLELMEGKVLPGLDALTDKKN